MLLGNGLSKPTDNVGQQLNDKFWGGFSQLGFLVSMWGKVEKCHAFQDNIELYLLKLKKLENIMMTSNLNYYDINAPEFFESTFQIDMESLYQPFLRYLAKDASILDLGCGSGRDTLAFKNKGYQVSATDYSKK